jgi:hypothetical protein
LPNRYGLKKPESLTNEHVQKFIETCLQVIKEELPNDEQSEKLLDRLSDELEAAEA